MGGNGFNGDYAIGVDIGGTKINFGVIGRKGNILCSRTLPSMAMEKAVMQQVFKGVDGLFGQVAEEFKGVNIKGIGVGCAGQINNSTGAVHFATDLIPGFTGTPIRELLQKRYSLPGFVDNDVNVLALSEKYLGEGSDSKCLICIALGTGVGGAVMLDGKIMHGALGGAGEIGHMSVNFKGPECNCGNYGCLEMYASGTGISRRMLERMELEGTDKEETGGIDSREVVSRWLKGDKLASKVMEETIEALGTGIASLIHIFNPDRIILGGGVAEVGEPLMKLLREVVLRRSMKSMNSIAVIKSAPMGNQSGMIGAAMQVWEYGEG